jgi:hypothetical protein
MGDDLREYIDLDWVSPEAFVAVFSVLAVAVVFALVKLRRRQ